MNELKLICGSANKELAEQISKIINKNLVEAEVGAFNDGETKVKIKENVRGTDIYVIQPTCPPVNHNLMELLIIIDALRRASAKNITAVIPYYGYGRQDRKVEPRVPISAKLVANLLATAGVDRILTIDLHAGQIQGFFDIPVDNLFAAPIIAEYIKKKELGEIVVVSPDAGGVERARNIAEKLKTTIAIIDKRRSNDGKTKVMHIIGEVKNKNVIILDDIIDTGGTLLKAADALKEKGANYIIGCCTHAVLSGNLEQINNSVLDELVVTNTIPIGDKKDKIKKLVVLSVAKLLGEAIKCIHEGKSVSALFDFKG